MPPRLIVTILSALLLLGAHPGLAWDDGGHQIVAEIAYQHLRPSVAAALEPLFPLLDRRANHGEPYHFVTAGPWMDDIKAFPKDYRWNARHYVNLECDAPLPRRPPKGENSYSAVRNAMATLRNPKAGRRSQAEALAQVIHIVADIHQPLHNASRHDRGGNGYLIVPPFRLPSGRTSTRPYNLHRFWDGAYRFSGANAEVHETINPRQFRKRPKRPGEKGHPVARYAAKLQKRYPPQTLSELNGAQCGGVWRWISESHGIAKAHGWPAGPRPAQHEVGRLSPEFVDNARQIAERRLVLAGLRLAQLLNTLDPSLR